MDKQEKGRLKVAVCGNHLVISAIGASLQEEAELEVQEIESFLPGIYGKQDVTPPDVVLFDLAAAGSQCVIQLMHAHPRIMVIGIDLANMRMLVLSGMESRLLTGEDLLQAIRASASM